MWKSVQGTFTTRSCVQIDFFTPEFHPEKKISWKFHPAKDLGYDMIIGRDLLSKIGMNINFKNSVVQWESTEIPMKPWYSTLVENLSVQEELYNSDMERIKRILDAQYDVANLEEITSSCSYLLPKERQQILDLLNRYSDLFDSTVGK